MQLGAVLRWERHIGQHVWLGLIHEGGELWQFGTELVGDLAPLSPGRFGIVLGEGGGDEGGDDTPAALAGMRQDVAHEVHAAMLPGSIEHLGDGSFDALMSVGDHQLYAAKPAAGELAQERRPERLGLGRADIHAQNLAPAVTVDADGDDYRNRHDAAILAHLHVGGIDPQIRPIAFDRAGEERLHLVVDLAAEPSARYGAFEGARAVGFALPSYTTTGEYVMPS